MNIRTWTLIIFSYTSLLFSMEDYHHRPIDYTVASKKKHKKNNDELKNAIINNDTQKVDALLKKEPLYGERDRNGKTYLHYAATLPTPDILILIMSAMLKHHQLLMYIDEQDDEGFTALHVAVKEDRTENVRMLLRWGADINVGIYPIYLTSQQLREHIMMIALKRKPQPNTAIIHLLLEAGIIVDTGATEDGIPLDYFLPFSIRRDEYVDDYTTQDVESFTNTYEDFIKILHNCDALWWQPNASRDLKLIQTFLLSHARKSDAVLCEHASTIAFADEALNKELGTTSLMRLIAEAHHGSQRLNDFKTKHKVHPELLLINKHGQTIFDILSIRLKEHTIKQSPLEQQDTRFYKSIAQEAGKQLGYLMSHIRHHGSVTHQDGKPLSFNALPSEIWHLILSYVVGNYLYHHLYNHRTLMNTAK